jgi:hypothetical protein
MMARAAIKVDGLEKTLRALSVIDPEQMKAFRTGFRQAAQPIIQKAQSRVPTVPLSGWNDWGQRLDWNQQKAKTGITTSVTASRRSARLRLVSRNAAAAVFENAGSRNDQARTNPRYRAQSLAFNRAINSRYGQAPRLLVRTWKQEQGIKTTYKAVGREIRKAEQRVQAAMR